MSISFSKWNDKTEMVATGVESCWGKFEEIFEFKGGKPMDDVETSGKICHQDQINCDMHYSTLAFRVNWWCPVIRRPVMPTDIMASPNRGGTLAT